MAKFTKYLLPGLGMAAGTIATTFGIRAGVRWWQQYQQRQNRQRMLDESRRGSMLFHPAERQAIPATGTAAMPEVGVQAGPSAGRSTVGPMPLGGTPRDAPAHPMPTGWEPAEPEPKEWDVENERLMDASLERETEAAGAQALHARDASVSGTEVSDTDINMDTLVGPLIDYLIAFNSIMNVLRSQRDTGEPEKTLGDREGMRNVLEQVQDRLPKYAEGKLQSGSLEDRTYRLAARIRDALGNLKNTDSDFLKLYDEVRPEICSIAQAIQASGSISITGMDQVRDMYECR